MPETFSWGPGTTSRCEVVDGKEIYYTGGGFTPPSIHRPKHRDGARRFASDTPQVYIRAYISDFVGSSFIKQIRGILSNNEFCGD